MKNPWVSRQKHNQMLEDTEAPVNRLQVVYRQNTRTRDAPPTLVSITVFQSMSSNPQVSFSEKCQNAAESTLVESVARRSELPRKRGPISHTSMKTFSAVNEVMVAISKLKGHLGCQEAMPSTHSPLGEGSSIMLKCLVLDEL